MLNLVLLLLLVLPSSALVDTLAEADELFQKGDFNSAAKMYRAIVQQDPANEKAQTGLIRSLLKEDDVEAAEASAKAAQVVLPSSSPIFSAMGDVQFRKGDLSNAEQQFNRAIQLNSQNGRAYLGLAKLHSSNFNRKSARLMDRKAYENNPEDPEIIYAFSTDLPAAQQIPLLEKYLELGLNEPEFRLDSARSHVALLKAMGDRKTWLLQGEPHPTTLELQPIRPSPGRQIGYELKASINGEKPVELHFDRGFGGLLIHRKLAEKLGVQIISESQVYGIGDEGKRKSFSGLAASIRIGDVEFHDCTITVSEKKLVGDTQGLIGSNIFHQFLISLNLPKNRVELQPLPAILGRRYDDPITWGEIDRPNVPELSEMARVRKWGHLLLDTQVNGKAQGFFYLDTGAEGNLISLELARKVTSIQSTNGIGRGLSGKVKDVSVARSVLLEVGGLRQQNDEMDAISFKKYSKDVGLEISGLLGHPLLSQLIIFLDYRDGLVDLIYPSKKSK